MPNSKEDRDHSILSQRSLISLIHAARNQIATKHAILSGESSEKEGGVEQEEEGEGGAEQEQGEGGGNLHCVGCCGGQGRGRDGERGQGEQER